MTLKYMYMYWVTIYCTWCEFRLHEIFVGAEYWVVNLNNSFSLLRVLLSMYVLFTSTWTVVVMYRGSNHSEMVNIFIILIVQVSFVTKIRTAKRCDRMWLLRVFSVYWEGTECTGVRLALQLGNCVLTFRYYLSVPSSGFHFVGSVCLLLILRHFLCVED
jgi:hypothetical protein